MRQRPSEGFYVAITVTISSNGPGTICGYYTWVPHGDERDSTLRALLDTYVSHLLVHLMGYFKEGSNMLTPAIAVSGVPGGQS